MKLILQKVGGFLINLIQTNRRETVAGSTINEVETTSGIFGLNLNDLFKGLVMSVLGAVVGDLYAMLQAGSFVIDWQAIKHGAIVAAVAYIMKQIGTPSQRILKIIVIGMLFSLPSFGQNNISVKAIQSWNTDSATVRSLANMDSIMGRNTGWLYYNRQSRKWRAGIATPDSVTWFDLLGGGGSNITASNGLTKVGNDIRLGGTLTQPSTTLAAGTNAFQITATGPGAVLEAGNFGVVFPYNVISGSSGSISGETGPNFLLNRTWPIGANNEHGIMDLNTFNSPGQAYASIDLQTLMSSASGMDHYSGYQNRAKKQGAGTLTNFYGFRMDPSNLTVGTITNKYDFLSIKGTGGATLTNNYSFFSSASGAPSVLRSGSWSFYTERGGSPSFYGAEARFERSTATTNAVQGVNYISARLSSGSIANGFGPAWTGIFTTAGGTENTAGFMAFVRNGADNTADWVLQTANAGTSAERLRISNTGVITSSNLAGTGTQMVTADINGVLSKQAIPSGGTPGGADTQIQYNNSGSFAGTTNMVYDAANAGTVIGGGTNFTFNFNGAVGGIAFHHSTSSSIGGAQNIVGAAGTMTLVGYGSTNDDGGDLRLESGTGVGGGNKSGNIILTPDTGSGGASTGYIIINNLPSTCVGAPTNSLANVSGVLTICP